MNSQDFVKRDCRHLMYLMDLLITDVRRSLSGRDKKQIGVISACKVIRKFVAHGYMYKHGFCPIRD
jgi:hypothetical protein